MSWQTDEHEYWRAILSAPVGAAPSGDCPNPERIWLAACCRLEPAELGEIVDHLVSCPRCANELGAAKQLAEEVGAVSRTSFLRELLDPLADYWRGFVQADIWRADTGAWRRAPVLAAALVLLVVAPLGVELLDLSARPTPVTASVHRIDRGPAGVLELLVEEAQALPRNDFLLRWRGPEGARYDLRVMSLDLDVIHTETDLDATESRLPVEKLAGLESGATLQWQLKAYLPDGRQLKSKTLRARLE